jgi:hypothetical protein
MEAKIDVYLLQRKNILLGRRDLWIWSYEATLIVAENTGTISNVTL